MQGHIEQAILIKRARMYEKRPKVVRKLAKQHLYTHYSRRLQLIHPIASLSLPIQAAVEKAVVPWEIESIHPSFLVCSFRRVIINLPLSTPLPIGTREGITFLPAFQYSSLITPLVAVCQ